MHIQYNIYIILNVQVIPWERREKTEMNRDNKTKTENKK